MTTLRQAWTRMGALVPAAMGAWALALIAGWAGAVTLAILRDSSAIAELAAIYLPVMIVPFGLGVLAVMLPVVACACALVERRRTSLLLLAGLAASPLALVALVAAGRVVFSGSPRVRLSLSADLAAVAIQPDTVPILIALGIGGVFMGWRAARMPRSGTSPTNFW